MGGNGKKKTHLQRQNQASYWIRRDGERDKQLKVTLSSQTRVERWFHKQKKTSVKSGVVTDFPRGRLSLISGHAFLLPVELLGGEIHL